MKYFLFLFCLLGHFCSCLSIFHQRHRCNPTLDNAYEVVSMQKTSKNITLKARIYPGTANYFHFKSNLRFRTLEVQVLFQKKSQLRIIIREKNKNHWEIPEKGPFPNDVDLHLKDEKDHLYNVEVKRYPFGLKITRLSTNETIFDTTHFNLILSDRFLEFSSIIPSENVFGIGESNRQLKVQFPAIYTIWARDIPGLLDKNEGGAGTYGLHPMYLAREKHGFFNVVFLRSSNGMDIMFNDTSLPRKNTKEKFKEHKTVTYKIKGGVIDLKIFMSEDRSPERIIHEYHEFLGGYTLQPFWSFGFHQSRWGYRDLSALNNTLANYEKFNMPLDAIWMDIDYMRGNKIFTIDETRYDPQQLNRMISEKYRKRLVLILDPGVHIQGKEETDEYTPFERGLNDDIFIKTNEGKPLPACVWAGPTYFPDFLNPKTEEFWKDMLKDLHSRVNFSGIWLDMNELANFANGVNLEGCDLEANGDFKEPRPIYEKCNYEEKEEFSVYTLGGHEHPLTMENHALCLNAKHFDGSVENDVHNLNAFMEAKATYSFFQDTLNQSQPFILSRSTKPGAGKFTIHWSGDNVSSFKWMKVSIGGLINFNMFGIPNNGADICGFAGNADEQLCARWMQLGSLYPFSRNHNSIDYRDQDPFAFGGTMMKTSMVALRFRYSVLKYYYFLFVKNKGKGMVVRPLFFEFPDDENTYQDSVLEEEFLIGKDLLVTPVLKEDTHVINPYFPGKSSKNKVKWYELNSGKEFSGGSRHFIENYLNETAPVFLRNGRFIYRQEVENVKNTEDLNNVYYLSVALDKTSNINYSAKGTMMAINNYNDQKKVDQCLKGNCLLEILIKIEKEKDSLTMQINVEKNILEIDEGVYISRLELYGLDYDSHSFFSHNRKIKVLDFGKNIMLKSGKTISIKFN